MNDKTEMITAIIEAAHEIAQDAESLECRKVPIGLLAEAFDHLMAATVVLELARCMGPSGYCFRRRHVQPLDRTRDGRDFTHANHARPSSSSAIRPKECRVNHTWHAAKLALQGARHALSAPDDLLAPADRRRRSARPREGDLPENVA